MPLFLICFLLLFANKCTAQVNTYPTDKIYLNDSVTIYEGLVIEQAPARYVKIIRQKEQDTVELNMKDIWKMQRLYPAINKPLPRGKTAAKTRFLYAEILGSGGLYSLNYDFRFDKTTAAKWGLRAGIEYLLLDTYNFSGDKLNYSTLIVPFMVNYLVGNQHHFLELGVGAAYVIKRKHGTLLSEEYEYFIGNINRRIPHSYGTLSIGYRYQPVKGKLMWGIALTPMVGNSFILPNMGFKIGYSLI
jgi:hypothetical protein